MNRIGASMNRIGANINRIVHVNRIVPVQHAHLKLTATPTDRQTNYKLNNTGQTSNLLVASESFPFH